MDPTSLPTDNLYKFLALAGLMLAGFCGWLKWKIGDTQLTEAADLLDRMLRVGVTKSAQDPEAIAEVASLRVRVPLAQGRWKRVDRVLPFAIAFGVALSVAGFALWYLKLQWYTDKQTKADFEDHMAELAAKQRARAKVTP